MVRYIGDQPSRGRPNQVPSAASVLTAAQRSSADLRAAQIKSTKDAQAKLEEQMVLSLTPIEIEMQKNAGKPRVKREG